VNYQHIIVGIGKVSLEDIKKFYETNPQDKEMYTILESAVDNSRADILAWAYQRGLIDSRLANLMTTPLKVKVGLLKI